MNYKTETVEINPKLPTEQRESAVFKLLTEDLSQLTNANSLGGTPAWLPETVTGKAPERYFHSAFYSSASNDLVVFGGESEIGLSPADDHVFILSVANGLK